MHMDNLLTYRHLCLSTKICMGMTDTNLKMIRITEEEGRVWESEWSFNDTWEYVISLLNIVKY